VWIFALYVYIVLTISAAICGHIPLTHRLYRRTLRAHAWWKARRAPAVRPTARTRPVPSWAHTEPYDYDEAA